MSYKQPSPIIIAEGGTNAITMANTFGVNYFDGTRIVTTTVGTATHVLTSNGVGVAPTFQAPAASSISITGNSGGALVGNAFTFTGGTTGLLFSGAGSTETLTGTLIVANGGTGNTTFTAYSVICAGTTATGVFQNVTGVGSAGNILTSNGAATLPSWQAPAASSISITGDTGGALVGSSFTFTGGTTGLSFGGSGSTQTLTFAGITANGGTVSLATDATASTVNVGTGAGAKTVTLGSTNTTSSLGLRYGTADFSLASATGNVIVAQDTGEVTKPLQPAFMAYLGTNATNATGNGTAFVLGSGTALTEVFDVNSDFNTNGTFTAPVTGKYSFCFGVLALNNTLSSELILVFTASNRTLNVRNNRTASATSFGCGATCLMDMDAADTCTFSVIVSGNAGDTVTIQGSSDNTWITGTLSC